MLWTAWHVPHSHFFSFSSFFRLLRFGDVVQAKKFVRLAALVIN